MPTRFYILFVLVTLLFLFYPGDSLYFHLFSYHPGLFLTKAEHNQPNLSPIAYIKNAPEPLLTAKGVYIADLTTLSQLYAKNPNRLFFPASTTKVITALVALDVYKPSDIITINRTLNEGQTMGLVQGERISVENLLYGLLVYSGNDAAYALADHYGFDTFIDRMNAKAKDLHMYNSHFVNPAGLDDIKQYTTPFDLALASRALLANTYLKKIVGIKEITISDEDYKYFHRLTNVNELLGEIQGIGGLKTGYTENAGENLVSFYQKDGHQTLIVVMKSEDRFADTRTLIDWINMNVRYIRPATHIISQ